MEEKGLIFEKIDGINCCNIVLEADSYDVHTTIDTLLECLSGMDEGLVSNKNRACIVQVIRALLPSKEQIHQLSKSQIGI